MTTLRDLTADDIATLAGILTKLRPHGAPRWQPAGVRASLAKIAHYDAADSLMAAIRLSQDRTADTPAQIAMPSSECWRERVSEPSARRQTEPASEHCAGCGLVQLACESQRLPGDDHEFVTVARARGHRRPAEAAHAIADAVKAELRPLGDRPDAERPTQPTITPGAGRARVDAAQEAADA